ncbi:MAG TPA: hypothetical protein VHA12_02185 [Candidatus Nanoarchaeia archaeon]|nr:hypothetical protein [Candidatus Nanoarchaeia archaeon]
MKKSFILVCFLALTIILGLGAVSAKFATEQAAVSAGYQCLYGQIENKSALGFDEAVYTSLAVGFNNISNNTFNSKKSTTEDCWPNNGCTLKETAQVGIVYDFWGRNTTTIKDWISSKNSSATGIEWFLETDIENQLPATCTIREDVDGSSVATINIGSDQKLSGNPGSCFTFARSDYLMKFNDNCIDKNFVISCSEEFLTTTIYKKSTSETYYVNSDSHTASAEGTTEEKVSAKCFKGSANSCDYEGSLWASLALQQFGIDVTPYMPYLIAFSDEDVNKKILPSAFLYMLTESSDAYSELTQAQQQNKYWRADPNNSRLYDTSLAMMALQGSSAQELTRAKSYVLEVQENNGCWNSKNVRDTAFILYSAWPQNGLPNFNNNDGTTGSSGTTRIPPIKVNNTNSTGKSACELGGYSCTSAFSCLDAGGVLKSGYSCTGRLECCTVKPAAQETCKMQEGTLCAVSQRCEGRSGAASDGSCCFGTCVNIQSEQDLNECETQGFGLCQASCGTDEYDTGNSCSTPGYLCCTSSGANQESSSMTWVWILLLLILIVLAALAIFYKDKIKLWWFKMQNKKQPPRPGASAEMNTLPRRPAQFGGFSPRPVMTPRPGMPIRPMPGAVKPKPTARDKEMEDTLKKLKEMSE